MADKYDAFLDAEYDRKIDDFLDEASKPLPPEQIESRRKAAMKSMARAESPTASFIADAAKYGARQVGLTARHGIEGVGGMLDFFASPIRQGMNYILPDSMSISGDTGKAISDLIGLPTPNTEVERVSGDIARTLAGSGGMFGAAKAAMPITTGATNGVMQALASAPKEQLIASVGAGAGSGLARESGASPYTQAAMGLLGGIAAPTAYSAGKYGAEQVKDIASLIGASFGNKNAIQKLASDAATNLAGDDIARVQFALTRGTEHVPGVKPTVAEAIAQQNIGQPSQFGGATMRMQKTLSGIKGAEDILPSAIREQKSGIERYKDALEAILGPKREAILASANKTGGVDPTNILKAIDDEIASPRITDFAKNALLAARQNIAGKIDDAAGTVNAEALYTSRMELNKAVRNAIESRGMQWDKKQAGVLDRVVQKAIDNAIESSGGKGWISEYMRPYAKGFANIRAHEARAKEAKEILKEVKGVSPAEIIKGEAPRVPTLLSRPMMAINFALKTVLGDANTPVAKELARRMADPVEYAKLLQLPVGHPTRTLVDKVNTVLKASVAQQATASEDQQ